MSNTPSVLLIDDGELDDVRELLQEVHADFVHLRGGSVPASVPPPVDLFVATSRRAVLASNWPPPSGSPARPTKIAVVTEDSNTLRNMLRRLGFDLLIRRPVHPYAFRLLVLHALYSGDERRRERRVPIGAEISYRSGLRRKTVVLADLSLRGCRLLSKDQPKLGARLTLQLGREVTGGKALSLRTKVLRVSDAPEGEGQHAIALAFDGLKDDQRRQVFQIMRDRQHGPAQLAKEVDRAPRADTALPDGAGDPLETENRRKHGRSEYVREVVNLDQEASQLLMGRDISVGGMSVTSSEPLAIGDSLRLAIYGEPREDPFIVRASVVRRNDDGTFGLQFGELKSGVAARLERLVGGLPGVEPLDIDEAAAMGSVVTKVLPEADAAAEA